MLTCVADGGWRADIILGGGLAPLIELLKCDAVSARAKAARAIPSTIFFADDGCTILLPILCADAGWTVLPSRFLSAIPPMQARIVHARNLFFVGQLLYLLPRHIACAEAVLLLVILVCAGLGRY